MARPGSGSWAAAEYASRCKDSRLGRANLQGHIVRVVKEAVPAYEALAHIMTIWGYRIRPGDTYGYYCRMTASGTPSPHSTGTAVDINARTNPATGGPYGGANRLKTDMPMDMVNAILGIRTITGHRVFGWGGHFRSFKDAMHFEIVAPRAALQAGLDPATLRGFTPGKPAVPGPVGGTNGNVGRPGGPSSTQGQGASSTTKPQGPAPKETAPPPKASLSPLDRANQIKLLSPKGYPLDVMDATHTRSLTEPSTLTVRYADPKQEARTLAIWRNPVTLDLDGVPYTLQRLDAEHGTISAEFIEHQAWLLTQHVWTQENRLTQSGGQGTRGQFMRAICKRVIPKVPVDIQPGQTALVDLACEPGDNAWQTLRQLADDVKWRLFATAGRIIIGADEWLAQRTPPMPIAARTPGIHEITWSLVFGQPVSEATIQADIATWSAPPSQSIQLHGQGPAEGQWLVESVINDLANPRVTIRLAREEAALEEAIPEKPEPIDNPIDQVTIGGPSVIPIPRPPVVPKPPTGSGGGGGGPDKWRYPAPGHRRVTSPFGPRKGRPHKGVDIGAPTGAKIVAARPGTVTRADYSTSYGNVVYIRHAGNDETRYAHLSKLLTRVGTKVSAGDTVGLCGSTGNSTGPHLHFEYRPRGGDAVNPWPYIKNAP